MNNTMCIFHRQTGEIKRLVECPDFMRDDQIIGEPELDYIMVPERFSGMTHMVNVQKRIIAVRPTLKFNKTAIVADDTDVARLVVGEDFDAEIDGVVYRVNGILDITSSMPARYRVVVRHFPYQDFDQEIVAT